MPQIEELKKYKNIHMIGIGGVSMSGIAAILHNWGFHITGSDWSQSDTTDKLNYMGIPVVIGHNIENVKSANVVVYSAAIKQDDPEMQTAQAYGIPTIERADFLGILTRCFKDTICISGTHGKTTTTSMVSLCFLEALLDPSIQVGAYLKALDGNYRVGSSEHFIIEACEYVESFLKFSPKAEIVLNIDNDHLDYFKTFENIKNAFVKYVKLLPKNGVLVVNGDDKNCLDLLQYAKCPSITYSVTDSKMNFYADNIIFDNNGFACFDVYKDGEFYSSFSLSIPGKHNVFNALACIALCDYYSIDKKYISSALAKFTGAHRRFEYKGKINGATIYDDYGHHPTEITATANSLKNKKYNESWVVFQPHTYSRTKNLLNDFATALMNFDHIVLLDIYAAREVNTYNISSKDLADKIVSFGKDAIYLPNFDICVSYLKNHVKENDVILTLGAGTVTEIGSLLLK